MSFREVSKRGQEFLQSYQANNPLKRLGRNLAFASVGWFARSLLNNGFKPEVTNLDNFHEAYRTSRLENRGLITVMNHTSVLDEPLCWGMLPWEHLLYPKHMRWTLGAENICFKNPYLATFFSLGQVLSTKRFGPGIFQGSIDAAIQLLSPEASHYTVGNQRDISTPTTNWIHMFPEGVVHQPVRPHNNTLRYFHWGVSRLILETTRPPIVLPIFTHGLEKAMPEDDPSFIPRFGKRVAYNVGEPIDDLMIKNYRQQWLDMTLAYPNSDDIPEDLKSGPEAQTLRSQVASAVRKSVLSAGAMYNLPPDEPRFDDPEFWQLSDHEKGVSVKTNQTGRHVAHHK